MRQSRVRKSLLWISSLAALLAVTTCTEGTGPLSPTKTWITPTGQVTSDPPELLVGAGDIGSCNISGDEATALLLDAIPGTVFTTGDNAYDQGTAAQYTNCYHPNWGRHKARTRPAPGNHEYDSPNAAGYFSYFGAAAGEIGKGYYSYNLGAWHIIVLNSSGGGAGTNVSMSKGSVQEQWLLADLAANQNMCTLAIWHHPLYQSTSGTGTGGLTDTKSRAVWDDLYAAGADLVLHGHRHFYERMAPQRPDRTPDAAFGIRSITVGTGGNGHSNSTNVAPNSEVRSSDTYGVLKLWLYSDSYAWKFVPIAGKTFSDSGSTACHGSPSGPTVSPTLSTVAATPSSLTAGSGSSTVTVTVRDGNGNPMSGVTVVLAATGSGNTLTQPSGTTNASGVATGTLSSTGAGTKTVSATANGVAITPTASITVNPGPVSAAQSRVVAAPTSLTAGSESSTITVTARDANDNPISGATVVLAATGGGNTLTQPSATTNASGVASGTLSSTVAEQKTVSATINGTAVTQTATVSVSVGAVSAALSTVSAAPTSLTAGSGSSTITVTVKDASGNPISGATVVLAATGSGNTLTQPSGTTNASGVATGMLSSTLAQAKTVSATASGVAITQTALITVNPGPVSAGQSSVAASPTSLTAGSGNATITVTARDAQNNPISGATVVLSATGSGNTLTQPSATTNASGAATGSLSSTVVGVKTISATIDGTGITQTATVTVASAPVSPSQSSVAAAPSSLTAGSGSATITVTVRDASGDPIDGATVVLAATGSGNTLTQPSGTSDANGVVTGTLSSTGAGIKTVSATANGTAITETASITVVPGPVSAAQSTVAASPSSIEVGTGTSTITVTAKDASGNPISGATVVLEASGSGNILTQPSGTTNANGVATGTLRSPVSEQKTVSATINGTGVTQTATVTVTAGLPSASLSTVAASPTSFTASSGSSTITVTVRDASGNPISGAAVSLAATGSGNTLTQPAELTDASGVATGTLGSTAAGTKTVSATANGVAITQVASITVNAGPVSASQSSLAAAPTSLTAGGGSSTITVTARDANGNPISGATVVLSATGTGNSLTQPAGVTNASGVATGSFSSTVAEAKTVSATIDGTGIAQTATVTVNAAAVSASQSSVAAAPASLTAGSGSATISVTVRDANGNPISGATVVLAATGTGNTITQPTGTTDGSGVGTGLFSSTAAGTKTVSATANGTAITQTATVSVTPGPVSASVSTVTAAPASIAVGTGSSTVTVTAKDGNGNPISGATVVLSATGTGNTVTQPSSPTDASGTATGTLSSSVAETKTIAATASGVAISQTAPVTVTPAGSTVVLTGAANVASCGSNVRDEATATLLDAVPGNVILVGSGAYPNGTAASYADCYGPSWGRHKARTYPTPGNQDYQTAGAAGYFGYFGAQAGDPTKGYYSFDLGDWHIIILNTGNEGTVSYALGSPQELWLKADLAANTKLCTMAVLHNTRWFSSSTAGWFNSGAAKHLWNALYAANADVVLSGRLYHYERMAPVDANGVRDDARGLRQFNLGTGGYTSTMPTFIAPNSDAVSAAFGVLRLNLSPTSYSWEFLGIPGSTFTDSGSGTCH